MFFLHTNLADPQLHEFLESKNLLSLEQPLLDEDVTFEDLTTCDYELLRYSAPSSLPLPPNPLYILPDPHHDQTSKPKEQ